MDPLSALIGPLMSSVTSLFTSSQASKAQAEQARMVNEGAYLPQLVKNAQAAGINPLAVIGKNTVQPNVGGPLAEGGIAAGRALSNIDLQKHALEIDRAGQEIKNLEAQNDQTRIQTAVNQEALERLQKHPELVPAGLQYPPERTSIPGIMTNPNIRFPSLSPPLLNVPTIPWADWYRRLQPNWGRSSAPPSDPYGSPF